MWEYQIFETTLLQEVTNIEEDGVGDEYYLQCKNYSKFFKIFQGRNTKIDTNMF